MNTQTNPMLDFNSNTDKKPEKMSVGFLKLLMVSILCGVAGYIIYEAIDMLLF